MMSINWHPWRLSNHPNNWPVFVDVWSVKLILIIFFQSHLQVCRRFPLSCPNSCGVSQIPREEVYSSKKHFVLETQQCQFLEHEITRSILVLYSPWGGCWSITTRPPGIMGNFVPRVSLGTTLHYGLGATLHIYYNLVMSILQTCIERDNESKVSFHKRSNFLPLHNQCTCKLSLAFSHSTPLLSWSSLSICLFLISGGSSSFTRLSLEFNSLSV